MSVQPIQRQTAYLAVYVVLSRNDKILALKRHNTGYMDGLCVRQPVELIRVSRSAIV